MFISKRSGKNKPQSDTVLLWHFVEWVRKADKRHTLLDILPVTLLNNRDFVERDIKSALGHVKDSVAGVYNKAQYLQDRKQLM